MLSSREYSQPRDWTQVSCITGGFFTIWATIEAHSTSYWSMHLDYCDVEWFALETKWDHAVIFETALKYCILNSFVDYEGCSISSKRFLATVVDIIVIWSKYLWLRCWRIFLQCEIPEFDPWAGKIRWRNKRQPSPVILPGKSHGQRSLAGYSSWGCEESDTFEQWTLSFSFLSILVHQFLMM